MRREVAVTAWSLWTPGSPVLELQLPRIQRRARPVPAGATALVAQVRALLAARRSRPGPVLTGSIDVRLGTRRGSEQADLEFLRSVEERGDAFGSPSAFAQTLSTAAGGELSLTLGLRGALATVSCGELGGLAAVVGAAAAIHAGRSEACLCGAMELGGADSDLIALLLLEPASPHRAAPRLVDWSLSFGVEPVPSAAGARCRPTMERLLCALDRGEPVELSATGVDGASAGLSVLFEDLPGRVEGQRATS